MEDFLIQSTLQEKSQNYSNITSFYNDHKEVLFAIRVVTYIIICIGLPMTLVAIYAVYSLVRSDHVAPIYVINLLISDLIQLFCMIALVAPTENLRTIKITLYFYDFSLVASVCFMVIVALERYLVIACPLWYRFRRTIKISIVVSVVAWAFPPASLLPLTLLVDPEVSIIIYGVFLLLPLPLLIFFLSGTLKALSASRVPSDEKRRIVGVLVLVLLIYTLLFLPRVIWFLAEGARHDFTFTVSTLMFLRMSPLADLILYVFMRKGTIDELLASVCCRKKDSNDTSSSVV